LFKGKNFYGYYCDTESPNIVFNMSESGWMEKLQFKEWFSKVFVKHTLTIEGPKILIFDGHVSHISLEIINLARTNNIHILLLPAHTTHFLQPLDVGVFPAVKNLWRKVVKEHLLSSNFKDINKSKFTELFSQLIKSDEAFKRHLIVGFEQTGIFPLNLNKMLSSINPLKKKSKKKNSKRKRKQSLSSSSGDSSSSSSESDSSSRSSRSDSSSSSNSSNNGSDSRSRSSCSDSDSSSSDSGLNSDSIDSNSFSKKKKNKTKKERKFIKYQR
jgi:hypothetical protein